MVMSLSMSGGVFVIVKVKAPLTPFVPHEYMLAGDLLPCIYVNTKSFKTIPSCIQTDKRVILLFWMTLENVMHIITLWI